jgi:hypothetical protein
MVCKWYSSRSWCCAGWRAEPYPSRTPMSPAAHQRRSSVLLYSYSVSVASGRWVVVLTCGHDVADRMCFTVSKSSSYTDVIFIMRRLEGLPFYDLMRVQAPISRSPLVSCSTRFPLLRSDTCRALRHPRPS